MTQPSRKRLEWLSWTIAIAIGVGGMYAAHQKAKVDAAKAVLAASQARELAQAESALARSEAQLAKERLDDVNEINQAIEALRDSAFHGHALLDSDGLVTYWNKPLERWTQWTAEEMIGRDLSVVMDPEKMKAHRVSYKRAMGDPKSIGKTVPIECDLVAKDGRRVAVRVNARIVKLKSGELRTVAFIDRKSQIIEVDGKP